MTDRFICIVLLVFLNAAQAFAQLEVVEYKRETIDQEVHLSVKSLLPAVLRYRITCDTIDYSLDTLLMPNSDFVKVLIMPDLRKSDTLGIGEFVTVRATPGDPSAVHEEDYLYQMPFEMGSSFEIMQSFKGKFSHNSAHSMYAIDFDMMEGSAVHAAREGRVVYYESHYSEGGRDKAKYSNKGNRILILHNDGTIATYNHLKKDGVLVELGDYIERGQLIGLSGSTGFSTKPHLHFVVRSGEVSVPIRFKGYRKLKKGKLVSVK